MKNAHLKSAHFERINMDDHAFEDPFEEPETIADGMEHKFVFIAIIIIVGGFLWLIVAALTWIMTSYPIGGQ